MPVPSDGRACPSRSASEPAPAARDLLVQVDGLLQAGTTLVISVIPSVVDFAARNHLPSIYEANNAARIGGLMVYAPRNSDNFRRAATYVDKILRGAKPADLPVEQPTTIDFVINLTAARARGLTVPQSVLQQATEVSAVKEGVELVNNKLKSVLQSKGVKAMETIGQPFDSDFHEAITKIPAPSEDLKGKVVDEVEKGYFLGDKVIRFAKVVVGE